MKTITFDETKWKLVPVESTPEMEWSWNRADVTFTDGTGRKLPHDPHSAWKRRYAALLASTPAAQSQPVTDEYAGVIAWIGDKQCKLLVTEDAIKHEHTPGVAMRNTAHKCVQEAIIAALREKEGK